MTFDDFKAERLQAHIDARKEAHRKIDEIYDAEAAKLNYELWWARQQMEFDRAAGAH